MESNIGLFNDCFPPVMDGVAVCVQNYAYWMQKKVGGVSRARITVSTNTRCFRISPSRSLSASLM